MGEIYLNLLTRVALKVVLCRSAFLQSPPGSLMAKHFYCEQFDIMMMDQSKKDRETVFYQRLCCLIPYLRWVSQAALRVVSDSTWLFVHS